MGHARVMSNVCFSKPQCAQSSVQRSEGGRVSVTCQHRMLTPMLAPIPSLFPLHCQFHLTKTNLTKPKQTKPYQTKENKTKPYHTKPNQTLPNQSKPYQTKPNNTLINQTKPYQTKQNLTKALYVPQYQLNNIIKIGVFL